MTARDFYGASYAKAKHSEKLDKAFERLESALKSEAGGGDPNGRLIQGMITLAAKSEAEAYIV